MATASTAQKGTTMRSLLLLTILCLPALAVEIPRQYLEGDDAKRARLEGVPQRVQLSLEDLMNAQGLDAAALQGKVVVLDFWATWCGPCIASIPHTNELAEKWAGKAVIIGVCHPRGSERMAATVKEHGIRYPVGIDAGGTLIESLEVNGFPDYYVYDQQGNLAAADVANREVEAVVELLLAAGTPR